ncbi:MAG: energy-coupling factor transporter transmembrane protein EcfT [Oscillospiraceae bacterium]|nr:energy-coupling factor transporter transmembrane protein EcfT [Oscillospiraceae bacterium]
MIRFHDLNPAVIAIWFFAVTGTAMFCSYPVICFLTLLGGVLLFTIRNGKKHLKTHLLFLILYVILTLANPLISHNGKTVLFVMNDNPVTLEALLYGLNSATMLTGVLYLFRSFTQIMTSEKLLYITSVLSPKISMVLSMAIRYVPLFSRQGQKVSDTQKAMGLYADDNIVDDITGRMRIFSSVSTWALENGIVTADSMAARGYGTGRRTALKRFSFGRTDVVFLALTIAFTGTVALAAAHGSYIFDFYPSVSGIHPDLVGKAGLAAFFLLVIMPVIKETEAIIRWRYLESKI